MLRAAKTSLFLILTSIDSSFDPLVETGSFYQRIAWGCAAKQTITDASRQLVALAEQAFYYRQQRVVEQLSNVLLNLPQNQTIGLYYKALILKARNNADEARRLFEYVSESGPMRYRSKALFSIGTDHYQRGDYKSALSSYVEAARIVSAGAHFDLLTGIDIQRMIGALKGADGDHAGAVRHLEQMRPMVRAAAKVQPVLYFDYMNSLAVEFGELGQTEEALGACRIALASPFAKAYPYWHETREEQEMKLMGCRPSRSFVAFNKVYQEANIVRLPVLFLAGNKSEGIQDAGEPGRILRFRNREHVMPKRSKDSTQPEQSQTKQTEASLKERQKTLINLILDESAGGTLLDAAQRLLTPSRQQETLIRLILDAELNDAPSKDKS